MNAKFYFDELYREAKSALKYDEVPVAALVVDPDSKEIIAKSHNKTRTLNSATAHAEILAINEACKKLGVSRLDGYDLYVSLEPCIMCAGAISLAKMRRLYFSCLDPKFGAVHSCMKFFDSKACFKNIEFYYGFEEEKFSKILKDFFKSKR